MSNVVASEWVQELVGMGELDSSLCPTQYSYNGRQGSADGWQCFGFANFAHWYIFAQKNTDKVTSTLEASGPMTYETIKNALPGDVLRSNYYGGHSMVFISCDENGFTVLDSNFSIKYACQVKVHTMKYNSSYNVAITGTANYDRTVECGHEYSSEITAPTCTEQGYTTYTCENCGDSYVGDYVEATGEHEYDNGVCIWCGKEIFLEGKKFSILGASISTYTGISNNTDYNSTIGKNAVYYTEGCHGVYANDTWWMQAANDFGLELLVNNSWSGSSLLYERNGTVGAYVDRCVQLHNDHTGEEPDIIAIQMGTNDFQYYKDTLGTADIDYDSIIVSDENGSYTYAEPKTSLEAAAIVLHKISVRYPDSEVYYLNISQRVDGTDELIRSFNAELKQVVEHFGAHIVDIYGSAITMDNFADYIGDNRVHPNKLGMDAYTEAFKRAVVANTVYEVETYTVEFELDGVKADYGDDKIVVSGDSFDANLASDGDALEVSVTMGGKDVTAEVYKDGKISIESVTGNVVINAKSVREPKNYRFEFNGTDLVCASGNNELTKKSGTTADGVFSNTAYALEKSIYLLHDEPWTVEWKSEGTFMNSGGSTGARIFTTTDKNAEYNARYIFKSAKSWLIAMGEKDRKGSHNYGIALENHGIDGSAPHIYRLENRIFEDGSNMIYLFVDGKEIGAMNNYYIGTTNQNKTSDWLSGKDFVFPFMGTDTHGFTNAKIDYIAVWEGKRTYPLGDLNLDGTVDVMDVYTARLVAAKLMTPTEEQLTLGDVDLDGRITAADANLIRKFSVGIIDKFPAEQ